jgi:hypothetical protein
MELRVKAILYLWAMNDWFWWYTREILRHIPLMVDFSMEYSWDIDGIRSLGWQAGCFGIDRLNRI